jgi:hypothetical protein
MARNYYTESINPFSGGSDAASTSNQLANMNDEKIFFAAIIRHDEALVKFSQFAGNYDDILGQVMPKIVKTNGIKMTLNYEK